MGTRMPFSNWISNRVHIWYALHFKIFKLNIDQISTIHISYVYQHDKQDFFPILSLYISILLVLHILKLL